MILQLMRFTFTIVMIVVSLAACQVRFEPPLVQEESAPPAESEEDVVAAEPTDEPTATEIAVVVEPTATVLPPTSTPEPTVEPTATPTLVVTETVVATPILTNTETISEVSEISDTTPLARLNTEGDYERVNVRGGPGTNYAVVSTFGATDEAEVIGQNVAGDWWQLNLSETLSETWVYAELVTVTGEASQVAIVAAPPTPTPAPVDAVAEAVAQAEVQPIDSAEPSSEATEPVESAASNPEALADELRCGKDFCVTFQRMLPIWENGGCVGNHSIYITVLQGLPPGQPLDGIVIGDTFNNVEVASGSHGPGRTEITLWSNSMTLIAKRHIDGTEYTSEESFNFTSHDELIPAEVLAANGYCEGRVETCRVAQQNNQVCRGHYSWEVTFHKFD